ncbi:ImpB/mucB/samB protein [Pseudomonas ficuserectae]|nr:ImpB/mucB/samB family protein [Pseudomonas ficuserectae]RMS31746.1 ImpB/mucB/samB protein [Pseudomonas ficuserectae]RMS39521.1 ImpB/mucB/samB protein [Pseudomonas ficuserectae]
MILFTKLHCLSRPLVDFLFHINGDMSERVMSIIESMVPASEIYSIDEAFADLTGIPGDLRKV